MALRILIVEDNPITREMLKEMIGMLGHEVVAETESLDDTLAAYCQQRPDAVTIDLSLPKEDGLSVLKALLRADAKARAIVISANCQERIRDEVFQTGAVDLITKPLDLAALRTCLDRISNYGNKPPGPASHPPAH